MKVEEEARFSSIFFKIYTGYKIVGDGACRHPAGGRRDPPLQFFEWATPPLQTHNPLPPSRRGRGTACGGGSEPIKCGIATHQLFIIHYSFFIYQTVRHKCRTLHKIHCRVRRPRRTALLNASQIPQLFIIHYSLFIYLTVRHKCRTLQRMSVL